MSEGAGTLVSVIVPARNAAATLIESLESAAAQTHRNLEILIVDDGSTDPTPEVAEEFCRREPRARLIRKEWGGLASTRNRAIEEAGGEFIAPLDADDLWHPEKIERQLRRFAEGSNGIGLVYCWYRIIDEAGRVTERPWGPVLEGRVFSRHLRLNFGTGSSPLIRRSALVDLRYSTELSKPGEGGTEDWLLQLEIARKFEIGCTPAYLLGYRARYDSMSADAARMTRSHIHMYEILHRNSGGLEAAAVRRELAYWRMRLGLAHGDNARTGALRQSVAAFATAPTGAARAFAETIANRLNRGRRRWLRDHPSVGVPFFALSPDEG